MQNSIENFITLTYNKKNNIVSLYLQAIHCDTKNADP